MLSHPPDEYRWVGPVRDANRWERRLVKVRMDPVVDWTPVPVEWLPETIKRPVSDFPQFWSGILCVSKPARAALEGYLRDAGEFLELDGLDNNYVGFHCLHTLAALDQVETEAALKVRKGMAFASPTFVPTLRSEMIKDGDCFRIAESFQKIFVSARFKAVYDLAGLTGLQFLPVRLI